MQIFLILSKLTWNIETNILKSLKRNMKIYSDYRIEKVEEKEIYINEKLSDLPIHQLIKQLKINEFLWDFDCVSL